MQTVGEILKQAMEEKDLSSRDVDRLTEEAGHRVAYSTIARIAKGTYQPSRAQIRAISQALGIRLQDLINAAGVEDIGDPFVLPEYANRLTIAERDAVRNIIRLLADHKDDKEDPHESRTNRNVAQFQAISTDAAFQDIAARNWRDDDPDLDDDNLLGDA